MSIECHLPPKAKRVSLIWVSAMRGDGTPGNPERLINLYFNDDGVLMACFDPLNGPADVFHAGACSGMNADDRPQG
ncbi:hypothetical protein [Pseudomonas fulva]|jgi:hypothetical protein|uniref:hypothetical protein n=1 Tax=Pseudomonas fulva TaxID=47880 RepID=UPI0034623205